MSATQNNDASQVKYGNLRPWAKGQSGNPAGRPKSHVALRQKCRDLTDELVERLRQLAKGADSDAASVSAIKLLLAYGHGAPEAKPIDDESDEQTSDGKVSPASALKALDAAPLTPEPRGPADSEN